MQPSVATPHARKHGSVCAPPPSPVHSLPPHSHCPGDGFPHVVEELVDRAACLIGFTVTSARALYGIQCILAMGVGTLRLVLGNTAVGSATFCVSIPRTDQTVHFGAFMTIAGLVAQFGDASPVRRWDP